MAVFDEARSYLLNLLAAWDYSSAFPAGYTGQKNVELVMGTPTALITAMQNSNNGQMVRPIISVVVSNNTDEPRTLGDFFGYGATQPKQRYATREHIIFTVAAWADAQLGGEETTARLAGHVVGCMFVNRAGASALVKPLVPHASREAYEERPMLWRFDTHVEGYALMSYDK